MDEKSETSAECTYDQLSTHGKPCVREVSGSEHSKPNKDSDSDFFTRPRSAINTSHVFEFSKAPAPPTNLYGKRDDRQDKSEITTSGTLTDAAKLRNANEHARTWN